MSLSSKQMQATAYINQVFWDTGELPTDEVLVEVLDVNLSTVKGWWKNATFRAALAAQGIDLTQYHAVKSGVLTPIQVLAVNMMMNTADRRSKREKLKQLNIKPQTWDSWLRQENFQRYLRKRAEEIHTVSDIDAYVGLAKNVQDGDLSAIKYHFEMRDIYNPRKIEAEVNIQSIILRLLEILQRHVRDPETLLAISQEVETLALPGETNSPVFDVEPLSSSGENKNTNPEEEFVERQLSLLEEL